MPSSRHDGVDSREKRDMILSLLAEERYKPLRRSVILKRLGVSANDRVTFRRLLKELTREGRIIKIKGGRYLLLEEKELVTAIFRGNRKGFGFVKPLDKKSPDLYVHRENVGTALDGDTVLVQIIQSRKAVNSRNLPNNEGKIVEILERANKTIVGTLQKSANLFYVVPDNLSIFNDIYIDPLSLKSASKGDKVICRITGLHSKHLNPQGEIVKVIGESKYFKNEIESIIERYNLPRGFSKTIQSYVSSLPSEIPESEFKQRIDYREDEIFTIDPLRAKDFDDAVSLHFDERKKEYVLGVHIADVSYYVPEGTPLDVEAAKRGNSYYLADVVIPMLPKRLSNDLCSLKEGVPRLTKSVIMRFSETGDLIRYQIHDSIIMSKKRFTYPEALEIIQGNSSSPFKKTLLLMAELSGKLRQKRQNRGSILFDMPELDIVIDENGEVANLIKEHSDISHSLIEEFMLAANETVARHLAKNKISSIYRIHPDPDKEKMENFVETVRHFGFKVPKHPCSEDIQRIIDQARNKPIEYIINLAYLKTMKLAEYSTRNIGHFGLSSDYYMHFTSPIRRYPDLVVHRCLDSLNGGKSAGLENETIRQRLQRIADDCSDSERKAEEAEKSLREIAVLRYLERSQKDNKAAIFKGLITEVNAVGMRVYLDEFLYEGIIKMSSLTSDYYKINRKRKALQGVRTGKIFPVGKEIFVKIKRIDFLAKELELIPVKSK